MSDAFVEISSLSKQFPKEKNFALEEISATLTKGQMVGLVGPDGAGKTTLIRLIAGLLSTSHGKIIIDGYDTSVDAEKIRQFTGYMPQKFGLYDDLTVQQNLDLYADLCDVVGEEKEKACKKLLEFSALQNFRHYLARNLSGGMKQKLGLACALIKKPTLLLLDEPTVGVDPISRRELWKMVQGLIEEGITVLWSTAYLDEAQKCDHVFLLNQGKILHSGTPKEFTSRVEGRAVLVSVENQDRRQLLFSLLKNPQVIDGVIQGEYLHLLLKEKNSELSLEHVEKVAPRFEDAFIDVLGGGPGGESKLAQSMPLIKQTDITPIRAENLTKQFGNFTAVDNLSLEVKRGEIFGLLGPNGAGKTTTFRMLCGLLPPTKGRALVNDVDFQKARAEARSHVGYMAQKFSLYGQLTVSHNLDFFAGIHQLKGREKKEAIERMIEIFNLEKYLSSAAEKLPLGFKQRLSLACANIHHPNVLFLDEPTSGVDPITRREFWNHINGLVTKGVTILITTHFMDEAEYCDKVALLYQGKIIRMDKPVLLKEEVKSKENPYPTFEDLFIQLLEKKDEQTEKNT